MGEYTDVVSLPLNGRVRTIDRCIHQIVAALNAGGVETVACCCGPGKMCGSVVLEDGRTLLILPPLPDDGKSWCDSWHRKAEEAAWAQRPASPPAIMADPLDSGETHPAAPHAAMARDDGDGRTWRR